MRHFIRYLLLCGGACYVYGVVKSYEYKTIWSDHAVGVHFTEWNPLVPLSLGWGFGFYGCAVVWLTSDEGIRWVRSKFLREKV